MKSVLNALLVIALLGFTFIFNIGLIDMRLEEVQYYLGSIAARQDASNTYGIVARYELIRQRMERGDDDVDAFELEARIQALTSARLFEADTVSSSRELYRVPVRTAVNFIRVLLGKDIVNFQEDDKIFNVIEIGYFWERNRRYQEAINIYSDVLENPLQFEIRAAIMVHKAFCYSMLNEYEKAKGLYERVISEFSGTEAGMISWRLLDFISGMEQERRAVASKQLSGLEKAKQFYRLMDFRSAIRYFSLYLDQRLPIASAVEARFYKARAHEELGETQEAMIEFRRVIQDDPGNRWSIQANRRLLMLGEFYEQQQQVAQEARRQLEAYQDQVFMNNLQRYSSMVSSSSLRDQLRSEIQKGTLTGGSDSIMDLINKIGVIDLTGEKAAQEAATRQRQSQQQVIEEAAKMGTAEIQELKRRRELASNPYRRPSFIRQVIDEHSSELRFIYNRQLRSGSTISGRMVVELTIAPDGTITSARTVQSTIGSPEFERQVVNRVSGWRFRAVPDTLGSLVVNYPFEFFEEQ